MKKQDIDKILANGLSLADVEGQLDQFKRGFSPLPVVKAAVVGDGILSLSQNQIDDFVKMYDKQICNGLEVVKFVPASGAATRMFKEIFEFVDSDVDSEAAKEVFSKIKQFAFVDDLVKLGVDIEVKKAVLGAIIKDPLNYGRLPKALIKFHKYSDGSRTALEEHLVEGAMYGMSAQNPVSIHFTVSPEHMELFKTKVEEKIEKYMNKYGVSYNISYSIQKPSTDTVAATLDNELFRNKAGELVFRPSGHGALIENLNDLNGELVFIKTVDNLQIDQQKNDTVRFKKALGALAVELSERVYGYIKAIDNGKADPQEVITFIEENLGYRFGAATNFDDLRAVLNRPLRVCGMVKNEGEPGGGPFWVEGEGGVQTLQIAESSQIADDKKELMKKATHFNPVDLVCVVKDYKREKFDLRNFIDPMTGFISEKSFEGKKLRAMERPGLWNGAMSNWNTVFVEVPISTFSPVKTVVDLLRISHQG